MQHISIALIAVVTQHLGDGGQPLGGVPVAGVDIFTPDVFRLGIGLDIPPIHSVDVRDLLANGALVLLDIRHAGLHVVIVHQTFTGGADRGALGMDGLVAFIVGRFIRAGHAYADHAVPIGLGSPCLLVDNKLVRHRHLGMEGLSVSSAQVFVDLQRNR